MEREKKKKAEFADRHRQTAARDMEKRVVGGPIPALIDPNRPWSGRMERSELAGENDT